MKVPLIILDSQVKNNSQYTKKAQVQPCAFVINKVPVTIPQYIPIQLVYPQNTQVYIPTEVATAQLISFGYKSLLKTYWLQGKLPTVKYGIYGGELTPETVTLEHLLPHSYKGKTTLSNLALSKNVNNWARSNKPLKDFFNPEAFEQYCAQFKDIKLPYFNGNEYVAQITRTVNKLLKEGR